MQNNRDTHHRRREKSAGAKESIRRFRHFFPSRSEIGASHTPPRSLVPHPCSFLGQRDDLCFPPLLFSPFPLFLTPPLFTSHPSFLSLSLSLPETIATDSQADEEEAADVRWSRRNVESEGFSEGGRWRWLIGSDPGTIRRTPWQSGNDESGMKTDPNGNLVRS